MKVHVMMVDDRTDGLLPISCDMRLEGVNLVLIFPEQLGIELRIPIESVGTLLNNTLGGGSDGTE